MTFKKLFIIRMNVFLFFVLLPAACFCLDEDGCLFCHQYPGMVRLERPSQTSPRLKILHIDEKKFLASIHGDLSCKKCHQRVKSVPHTGQSQVNCNLVCHSGDQETLKIDNYPLNGFHEPEQSYIVTLDHKTSCTICHQIYPHSNDETVRAFLNMHTGFMGCEVCHIKTGNYKKIVYEWGKGEYARFSNQPFGTFYTPNTRKTLKNKETLSRIAVYSIQADGKIDLTSTADIKKAEVFLEQNHKMSREDTKQALTFFHRDIERKEASAACLHCHSADGILDFKELGFEEKKSKNLISLNIKGLVTKYKTFYFPNLFEF